MEFSSSARAPPVESFILEPLSTSPPSDQISVFGVNPASEDLKASLMSWMRKTALLHSSSTNSQSREPVISLLRFGEIIKLDGKFYRVLINVKPSTSSAATSGGKSTSEWLTDASKSLAPLSQHLVGVDMVRDTASIAQSIDRIRGPPVAPEATTSSFADEVAKGARDGTLYRLAKSLSDLNAVFKGVLSNSIPGSWIPERFTVPASSPLLSEFLFDDGAEKLPRRLLQSLQDLGGVVRAPHSSTSHPLPDCLLG